jgi:hypothetical protein
MFSASPQNLYIGLLLLRVNYFLLFSFRFFFTSFSINKTKIIMGNFIKRREEEHGISVIHSIDFIARLSSRVSLALAISNHRPSEMFFLFLFFLVK